MQHYLGWAFYRQSPWSFPIGLNPDFGLGFSASIVYSDSIPLLALLFKPFDFLLSQPFQYLGIWTLLCFILQAFFAWLLIGLITQKIDLRLLATALFVFSPPLLWRVGFHNSLVGHFLILAALYLVLRPANRRSYFAWLALLVCAALTHSYLLAIVFIFFWVSMVNTCYALYFSRSKVGPAQGRYRQFFLMACGALLSMLILLLTLWQAGFFAVSFSAGKGGIFTTTGMYGTYGANLLALFYGNGWSYVNTLLLDQRDRNESFLYLGLGIIALIPFALWQIHLVTWLKLRPYSLIFIAALGLIIFSASQNVAIGPYHFSYTLPEKAIAVAGLLRASARLFWPVYYLLIWAIVYLIIKGYRPTVAARLLSVALVIQIIDTSAGWLPMRARFNQAVASQFVTPLKDPFWAAAALRYQKVVRIPADNSAVGWDIFASYAAIHHLSTSSAFLSRVDETKVAAINVHLKDMLVTGEFDLQTLYILSNAEVITALRHLRPGDLLARINGFNVLAPAWLACATCLPVPPNQVISKNLLVPSIGQVMHFNQTGSGQYFLAQGQWATPEPWGVWAIGSTASLKMPLTPNLQAKSLVLEARALLNAMYPKQIVQIWVNGDNIGEVNLTQAEHNQITIPIAALRASNKGLENLGMLHIEMQFMNSVSPKDLGMSDDVRKLAVGLESATFRK